MSAQVTSHIHIEHCFQQLQNKIIVIFQSKRNALCRALCTKVHYSYHSMHLGEVVYTVMLYYLSDILSNWYC